MSEITVYPSGRKRTQTWPNGKTFTGYDIRVEKEGVSKVGGFVAEYVYHGKRHGWIIVDHLTGEVILGAGSTTKVGPQRENALWVWQQELNKQAD